MELYKTRLPNNMKIPPSDIQVLTPTRKYDTGMAALNVRPRRSTRRPMGRRNAASAKLSSARATA
ncbi:MAG: hypothetical protein ACLTG4_03810 [Oscillospiraceae bacterium]